MTARPQETPMGETTALRPDLPDETKEMKHVPWISAHDGHDPNDPRVYTVESLAMVMCGCCSAGELRWRTDAGEWCHSDGSVIMDATNSSVGCIEWEHDGEPAGQVTRWDGAAEINARLIAAAPEMFEALLAVNKIVTEGALVGFRWDDGDWAERLFKSQRETSSALRKALGDETYALLRALSNGSKEGA